MAKPEAGGVHHGGVIFSVFAFAAYFTVVDSLLVKGVKAVLDFFTK